MARAAQLARGARASYAGTSAVLAVFDTTYALAELHAGHDVRCGGYHWVGIPRRGQRLHLGRNSAPGYKGVYDHVSRDDFDAPGRLLGGLAL